MRNRFPFRALLLVPLLAACGDNDPVVPIEPTLPRDPTPPTEAYLHVSPGQPYIDMKSHSLTFTRLA